MRAMVIEEFGEPERLVERDLPVPTPAADEVLMRVRAFGINRAETFMRKGIWMPPIAPVSGIECVGEVEVDPAGRLPKGCTVAALMGGMGRTRNGSYAQYTTALATNVVPLKTSLPWADLAAIPESYATAWSCLFGTLRLEKGQILLIRGATSALGLAAINLASAFGATVIGTTRSMEKEPLLRSNGVARTLAESRELVKPVRTLYPDGIDRVLDLLGNTTFQDSLRMVRKEGRVCIAGFLGGSDPVPFDVLSGFAPGAHLSLFVSFLLGTKDYPLSEIPLQQVVESCESGVYRAKPARVFRLQELPTAHRLMESNRANGKLVVVVED